MKMTTLEAQSLVLQEIESRYKNLTEAQSGDWTRAFCRTDKETALEIIHDLLDHPDKTLTLKQFLKAVPRDQESASRMGPAYGPWVACMVAPEHHADWQGRKWPVAMAGHSAGDQAIVGQYASVMAQQIQDREGGRWSGYVETLTGDMQQGVVTGKRASAEAVRLVMDGPDTPGRRFLAGLAGRAPQTAKDFVEAAVGTMLDRLQSANETQDRDAWVKAGISEQLSSWDAE